MAVAKVDSKKLVIYLAVGFLLVSIYNNPDSSSQDMGNLLGDVGHYSLEALGRGADFLSGLFNS